MSVTSLTAIATAVRVLSAIEAMPDDHAAYGRVTMAVHGLCDALRDAETAGVVRAEVARALDRAWRLHGRSVFIRRLQDWPRGYQGDYETIEHLMSGVNRSPPATIAHHLESFALASPISQQHRNKMRAQADEVRRVVVAANATGRPARILSIACGGSPDLASIRETVAGSACRFVITDADRGALDAALARLGGLPNVEAVCGNIFRRLRDLARLGPFDLVTAGGLYDYLTRDQARALTARIFGTLLRPGGRFFFTNIATGNPYRPWIENLARWVVIERSEAEMRGLMTGLPDIADIRIRSEDTALTWLASVDRADRAALAA